MFQIKGIRLSCHGKWMKIDVGGIHQQEKNWESDSLRFTTDRNSRNTREK